MIQKLLRNEIKNHKLLSFTTVVFMAVSSLFIALSVSMAASLVGSVNGLMEYALTPDYLQTHAGEMDEKRIENFAEEQSAIEDWQVSRFLNLDNSGIYLGDSSLVDNSQDNGLTVQPERFDYLLGMDNDKPDVEQGEVYVPACYRSMYDLQVGDEMRIGGESLVIAGFIRDSQMNSMMASSKRFLVSSEDYARLKRVGTEEYLIEFLLADGADASELDAAYKEAGLYTNGPTITKPLIRMMNALSDGIMIAVILLVGIAVLLISLLCISFITALGVERDRREAGMLKVLGIGRKQIRSLYFAKYLLFAAVGSVIGILAAFSLKGTLSAKLNELYGTSDSGFISVVAALLACVLVQALILLFVRRIIKRDEKLSVTEALFSVGRDNSKSDRKQYIIIGLVMTFCMMLTLIPQNLYTSMSSPDFVTYMGIGDAELRIDIRQSNDIEAISDKLEADLAEDSAVDKYTVLQTVSCPAISAEGEQINMLVETGDHNVYPVSYLNGRAPAGAGQIALSSLLADDLGLGVGDSLDLMGEEIEVCGIYSDITNGGKTAKMSVLPVSAQGRELMWSIIYLSLDDSVSEADWMRNYRRDSVSIVNISDYVAETYGPTIEQLARARGIALVIALIIIALVLVLFMRLLIEKKRYSISLQKALGFRNNVLRKQFFTKGIVPVLTGAVIGIVAGNVLGEKLCGMALKSFGADGFSFVLTPLPLILICLLLLATAALAVHFGTAEIKQVRANECCTRKE